MIKDSDSALTSPDSSKGNLKPDVTITIDNLILQDSTIKVPNDIGKVLFTSLDWDNNPTPTITLEHDDATRSSWQAQIRTRLGSTVGIPLSYELVSLAGLINDCSLQVGDLMHIRLKKKAARRTGSPGVYLFSITRIDNDNNINNNGRDGGRGEDGGRGGGGKERKKRKGKEPAVEAALPEEENAVEEVLFDDVAQVVASQEEEAEGAAKAATAAKKANADKGNKRATRGFTKKESSEIIVIDNDDEMEEAVAGSSKQQRRKPPKKEEEEIDDKKTTPSKKGKSRRGGGWAALQEKRKEILSTLSPGKLVNAPDLALYSQGHDHALTPVELYERMKNTSGRLAVAGVTDAEWRWIRKHVPIKTNGHGYAEFHLPDGSKKLTSRTQAIAKIRALMAKLPREELEALEEEEMDEKYFSYSFHNMESGTGKGRGNGREDAVFNEALKAKLGENFAKRRELAKKEREEEKKRRQEGGGGIDPDIDLSHIVDERFRKRKTPPPPPSSATEEAKPKAKKAKKKAADSGGTVVKQEELEAAYTLFTSRPPSDRALYMDVDITLLDTPTNLIGRDVNIYWPSEGQWFGGQVASYDASTGKHTVDYFDNTEEEHYLAMSKIKALIDGDEVAVCLSVERVQELVAAWQEHCDVVKSLDKIEDADLEEEDDDGDVVDYVKLAEEKVMVLKSMLPVELQSSSQLDKEEEEEEKGDGEEEEEEGKISLPNILPVIHPEPSQQQGAEGGDGEEQQQHLASQPLPSQQQLHQDQQLQLQHLPPSFSSLPSTHTHKNFHLGDLVWCDFKDHPPWPCIVTTSEVVVEESILANVNPPKKAPSDIPVKLLGSNKVAYTSSYKTYLFMQGMDKAYSSVRSGGGGGGRRLTMNREYKVGLVELYNWMQSSIVPPGFKTDAEDEEDDDEEEEVEEAEEVVAKEKGKKQQQGKAAGKAAAGGGGRKGPLQPKPLTPDGRKTKKQKTALATTKLDLGSFPITISSTLKVLSLGYIQWLHPSFHSKFQLWPVGYTIENKMASPASQKIPTSHICQILEAEDGSGPLFKITVMPVTYECDLKDWVGSKAAVGGGGAGGGGVEAIAVVTGRTPGEAWSALQSTTTTTTTTTTTINACSSNSLSNEPTTAIKRIGDNQFGLADSNVMRLIEQLDNVDKCKEYRPKYYKNNNSGNGTGSGSGASTSSAVEIEEEAEEEKMARVAYQSLSQSLPPGIKGVPYLPCGRANMDNVLQSHPCAVCGDDEEDDEDLLITCDCCNLMTHMSCYGIHKRPDGSPWLCDSCSLGLYKTPPPCLLCPVLGGPLKMTTDGRWCHRVCSAWMPETELVFPDEGDGVEKEKEKEKKGEKAPSKGGGAAGKAPSSAPSIFRGLIDGVNNIHSSRASAKTLKCSICKQEHGFIVQCCEPKCCVTVHAMCAQQSPFCGWKLIQDEDCVYLDSDDEEKEDAEEEEKKKKGAPAAAGKKAGSPVKKKAKTQDAMEEANAARDDDGGGGVGVAVGGNEMDKKGKGPAGAADAVVADGDDVDEDAGAKTAVQKSKKQNGSNEEEGGKTNPPAAAAWTNTKTPAFTEGLGGGADQEEGTIFSPTSIKRKKNLAKRDIKEGISVGNGLKLLVFCSKHGAQRMPGFARRQGALKGAAAALAAAAATAGNGNGGGGGGPLLPHTLAVLRHPVHGLSHNPTPVSQPKPLSRLGGGGGGGPGGTNTTITTNNGPISQFEAQLQRYGASRAMPYNQATRRGHRAPEAMAAAEAKRRFVTALPLKLGGARGMYTVPVLPTSRCIIHGDVVINNNNDDDDDDDNKRNNKTSGGQVAKKLGRLETVDDGDEEEEEGAAAAAAADGDHNNDITHIDKKKKVVVAAAAAAAATTVALKAKPSKKKNATDLDKQLAIFRRLKPHPPSTSERFATMRASIAGRIAPGKSAIHGWGMFALLPHVAHEFVIEYAGQLVRPSVSDHREETLYNGMVGAGTYIFRLNSHHHVDATRMGNLAHLINHSCDPNCYSRTLTIKDATTGVVADHVVIIAKRDIEPGEELTYDYRFAGAEELPCNCGAAKCRGVVNVRQREADEAVVVPKVEVRKVSIEEIIKEFEEEEELEKKKRKRKGKGEEEEKK